MDDYSELSGETPELVRGGALELTDLGGPDAELSTGLILTWRNKLVFGLDPDAIPLGARGHPHAQAFVGIGGHLDPGENWSQAVTREAQEEACCPISLGDSPITYWCQPATAPRTIAYRWAEACRPLLVWTAVFKLRRGPERKRVPVTIVSTVFRAAALNRPAPNAEITALLLMDQETLLHTYTAPQPVGELLARGAQIIGAPPAPHTLLAPGGSAYFYAQWLAWQEERPTPSGDPG
jgi:8-oxo-dGTP pyrophosphatase MutT (NUDIX family)